jgi:uncharacterized membrane protein YkvA (DUF1232 family)
MNASKEKWTEGSKDTRSQKTDSRRESGSSNHSDPEHIEIELNPRDRRMYDVLREKVLGSKPEGRAGIKDLLLLLPDLTVLLARLVRDSRVPWGAKTIAVMGLAYVFSPIDLIPDFFGPIGLLDDLLVAVAALSQILKSVHPDLLRANWSGKEDVLEAIRRITAWGEGTFKVRLASLLRGRLPFKF